MRKEPKARTARTFLKAAAMGALAMALAPGGRLTHAASAEKPNVILIMADDLGWAELGSYGQKIIRTPNLDRLAEEGMRFTQFYSGQAVCAPTRCSLLTGKHMGHSYIRNNGSVKATGQGQNPIPPNTFNIGPMLKAQGYVTGIIGKWGLGGGYDPETLELFNEQAMPNEQGWDFFFGYLDQRTAHNYYPTYLWRNKTLLRQGENDPEIGVEDNYSGDEAKKEALQFIDKHKDEPFFLYYPSIVPHVSLQVPADSLNEYMDPNDPYVDKDHPGVSLLGPETPFEGKQGVSSYTSHPRPRAAYAAMITRMDRDIGEILDRLKAHGIADNTVVIFTSDNGTTWCCGVDYPFFESVGPLRAYKAQLYEGGIRVPMIVRWPGRVEPGTVSDHISAHWDIMPTLAEICGAPAPSQTDGLSMVPTMTNEGTQKKHEYLYWEFAARSGSQAVRMGKWKAYREDVKKNPAAKFQLYDLESDIGETTDVAGEHPRIISRIEDIVREAHTPSELFPFPAYPAP